ncbi:Prefoldin, chaperonin cofactor [Flavobacterium segetis]|uniref:Prefoldin, chaperonin cofactor n=1 Tax=Flavobacterium segetis TaxID=271157 RepID=A0A1M5F7G4_9FLAO|nr:hypothetical protein [Flavobacterium segetis]SHF87514.1 Prefoldin, chaperonin cofactor [Flavobacterium segetis]
MNKSLVTVSESLFSLGSDITAAYSGDGTLAETWGWNCPPLNRHDLANLAKNLGEKIKSIVIEKIDEDLQEQLEEIPARINIFKTQNLPQMFSGNCAAASPNYFALIEWINVTIEPLFTWEIMQDTKALPKELSRRLRALQSELTFLIPDKDNLESQIKLIEKATEAAENLPADLESLKDARNKVNKFSSDAAESFGKIDTYQKKIESLTKDIYSKKNEAEKLVDQCQEAYRITTTTGLAASFDQRANKLSYSMWAWVAGLILALGSGIYIGSERFAILNASINQQKDIGHIWIQIFLSLLSLGAPIWFAWLATKQIGQRFKLSEDYAFKASVAKAYEGYRKEASRIDLNMEKRLFSSALDRLEEPPLRLMEKEHYGSPWHEFISSDQFKKALVTFPELKDKILNIGSKKLSQNNLLKDEEKTE